MEVAMGNKNKKVTASTTVIVPLSKVWESWCDPGRIFSRNSKDPEKWFAESLESNVQVGGHFKTRMFTGNGVNSFEFEGKYTLVEPQQLLEYTLGDGRNVTLIFEEADGGVRITMTFDTEHVNPQKSSSAHSGKRTLKTSRQPLRANL
jgi:uncharacterized protein YndB with AHSA1/START domain